MAHPCIGEAGRDAVAMAASTFDQQIGLDGNTALWIVDALDIMNPMAVKADRFVRLLVGRLLFEDHGGPVEITDIGVQDIGGDAVPGHLLFVRVASSAHLGGGFKPEFTRGRVCDVMDAMAIDAGRYIGVAFAYQSGSMDGSLVFFINGIVATGAGLGNPHSGFGSQFTGGRVGEAILIMRVVAVGADGRIVVPSCQRLLMNAVERLQVLFLVTLFAGGVIFQ